VTAPERGRGAQADAAPTDPLPSWWQPLLDRIANSESTHFSRLPVPEKGGRAAAVLILLGEGADGVPGPDVLLLQRAADMRNHAGQPAFPGGAADPGDSGPVATALREASEEVGLDPGSVEVQATLPPLWIPVSGFVVRPVLGWWRTPHPVHVRQPAEVARVDRVPVAELVDPDNRIRIRHPSGYIGAAFRVRGMLVWGFTAGILATLLDLAGWAGPWSEDAEPVALPIAGDRPVP
jgi:8-oxo-dGTP pyrophosphatase MutT (NUDIX family)